MSQTTGIVVERDLKGKPTFVHTDLRKYGELLFNFFTSQGVEIEQLPYSKKFVDKSCKAKRNMNGANARLLTLKIFGIDDLRHIRIENGILSIQIIIPTNKL
ncbi:MAG: hypothetical protein LBT78_10290 [Tannerella sp.]|jgi:hypothetical protein|nr:hypothetical protein [Tannerella sp.]